MKFSRVREDTQAISCHYHHRQGTKLDLPRRIYDVLYHCQSLFDIPGNHWQWILLFFGLLNNH